MREGSHRTKHGILPRRLSAPLPRPAKTSAVETRRKLLADLTARGPLAFDELHFPLMPASDSHVRRVLFALVAEGKIRECGRVSRPTRFAWASGPRKVKRWELVAEGT